MDTLDRNRQAFEGQAKGFSSQGDTYADEAGLVWMLAELPLSADAAALDVATGTGEFARALAPHVSNVIGLDATDAMLERGKQFIRQSGIENIAFQKGIVEKLPFDEQAFDIVASRYAFHHFEDPEPVLSEMARVCRTAGHVIVVDIVVPEESMAEEYNYYERLCDPSHTRCLGFAELQSLFRRSGLEVISARRRELEESVLEWMDFSLTQEKHREEILHALNQELEGRTRTGLAPYTRDSVLYFRQRDAAIVGRKI
ncbi:MAG: methyltransferase domain-containing protein [Myxococcales bacterium]|jgi:ubiquinone/menaquinone biosynthesis C-methylase UbiE|nr:methyltransferase domain-containing protein [Myxococcales bacterium]